MAVFSFVVSSSSQWLERCFGVDIKATLFFRGIFFLACVYILWRKSQKLQVSKANLVSSYLSARVWGVARPVHAGTGPGLTSRPGSAAVLCAAGGRTSLGVSCRCACRYALIPSSLE